MKFETVEIRPHYNGQEYPYKWTVKFSADNLDRVNIRTLPNDMGFYHYPITMGRKTAFKKLKAHLIKQHKAEIARLTKSMKSLEKLCSNFD